MNILEYVIKRIEMNPELKTNEELFKAAIREIMQEMIIPTLSKGDFFKENVFLGGTAFRMVYDLKRFSEDFDFTMKENRIKDFSWTKYADEIIKDGKTIGIEYLFKEEEDKFGNKILRIRSDSLISMLDGKGIVPDEFTNEGNRKKIKIKLETNFVVNSFDDEIKTVNGFNIRVLDLPSLFAGKINACLTREITNPDTHKKEKIDHGRDWYDLIKYLDKNIKPNLKFLTDKLKHNGPYVEELKNIDLVDINWVKNKLLERMEGLDYVKIDKELKSLTLEENRIIIDRELLIEKINKLGIDSDNWEEGDNDKKNNTDIINKKYEIESMSCIKCNTINNDSIINKISNIVEIQNKGFENNIENSDNLKKFKYTNKHDQETFVLEKKEYFNNGKYECKAWHFNKDFDLNSAKDFINQYKEYQMGKRLKKQNLTGNSL